MIKAVDIIKQLQVLLPKQTGLFTDNLAVTSLTRSGTTVTVVTAAPHGLVTGNFVNISGAKAPITITSLTQVDGIATAVTDQDHDLTENIFSTIELSGANESEYNGSHTLLTVPNRETFTFTVDSGAVSPATGTPTLIDAISSNSIKWSGGAAYNGRQEITLVDTTTFTYQTTTTFGSPAQGTIEARKGIRVSGAAAVEKAIESYTKQNTNDLWAYVVLDDVIASKDRNVPTDASNTFTGGEDPRQRLINPFAVYVIVPTHNDINGRATRDLMEDVLKYLFKSLLGAKLNSVLSDDTSFSVYFTSHSFAGYVDAYYVHRFNFETNEDITLCDRIDEEDTRAFRDANITIENPNTDLEAFVNLDDVPL